MYEDKLIFHDRRTMMVTVIQITSTRMQTFQLSLQTANTDAVSAGQAGAILTDGSTFPLVQVVSQPNILPILQEAGGTRAQILQIQVNYFCYFNMV
ncbi:unnamed protein product [Trichobilharzia regenti]|nr:unnamed protein product [Trichobilharzia regenti]